MSDFPYSSPKEILPYIMPIIRGRTFCDVGCGDGSVMKLVRDHVSLDVGIELPGASYDEAKKKFPLENQIVCGDFLNGAKIPQAEVYYVWLNDKVRDDALSALSTRTATIIVGRRDGDKLFPAIPHALEVTIPLELPQKQNFHLLIYATNH